MSPKPKKAKSSKTPKRVPSHKPRPRKRDGGVKLSEQDFVRETLSRAAGVTFEVVAPNPAFPFAVDILKWFMRCRNKDEIAQVPYLNAAWKDNGGIWLESLALGDTIDWIEIAYGEEQASKSLDLDYSRFEEKSFEEEFATKFPVVMGRIREYEGVAAVVSKRMRVQLEIRRAGSKGMLVFTLAAHVPTPKGPSPRSLGSALTKNVDALKQAYQGIEKL